MPVLAPAGLEDLPRLLALDASAGPDPWPRSALERSLRKRRVWLIRAAGISVGFLVEERVLDEATLMHLAVGGDHQGRGHARDALQVWLDGLARDGQRRCLLEVRAGNETARRLYQKLGFTLIGTRRGYYYRSETGAEDALVMERKLSAGEQAQGESNA